MNTETRHIVMRRIYYSFALSIIASASFWQGIVLGGSVALFGRLTHVAALWSNLLSLPIVQVPAYVTETIMQAIQNGEVLTVLVSMTMVVLAIIWTKEIAAQLISSQQKTA